MSAILLTDSSGRPQDPAFMAAASPAPPEAESESPPPSSRQCAAISTRWTASRIRPDGEAGRIVRRKMRWLEANSYGAIATRAAAG